MTRDRPPSEWHLSDVGRRRAALLGAALRNAGMTSAGSGVAVSKEAKAIETGQLLEAGPVHVDDRLGEIAKPWYGSPADHQEAVVNYLSGQDLPGWESRAEALGRFDAALSAVVDEVRTVVTHGTVWTLWLSEQVGSLNPASFWLSLQMPDAYEFDTASSTLQRVER